MSRDDKITAGILGSSIVVAILFAIATIVFSGCAITGCKTTSPIVHPTDGQVESSTSEGTTKEPPYVPWWAD